METRNKAYIKAISYYLPENILTNEDISREFPEWSVEKVAAKIGIKERRVSAENETALDLGTKAAEKLIAEHNLDKLAIDFILFCTQSPDYYLPTSACLLQERLGLSTKVGALDFNLGCSGYVYGLSLAKGLILANVAKNVLLVTSETYTKYIHPKDKGNRTIFGDAASATLVSTEGFSEINEFSLGTDGAGAENLIVKSGASKQAEKSGNITFNESGNPVSEDHLYMNGSEIFNFTLASVPTLVKEVLENNEKNLDDVDLFVFHQANQYMLEFLRKKIKIPTEKFYYYMENVGNTVSSTIPIALREAQNEGILRGNVLLAGFGVGYSWGGVILNCK